MAAGKTAGLSDWGTLHCRADVKTSKWRTMTLRQLRLGL